MSEARGNKKPPLCRWREKSLDKSKRDSDAKMRGLPNHSYRKRKSKWTKTLLAHY
jgi:hypothetical protein